MSTVDHSTRVPVREGYDRWAATYDTDGNPLTALTDLTSVVTNSTGQIAGPFMASIPAGPAGWGTYVYTPVASAGTFTVSNSGDSTTVSLP